MKCHYSTCGKFIREAKICRHCLLVKYCSNECRTFDWHNSHKKLCESSNFSLNDFIPAKQSKSLGKGAYGEVRLVQHIGSRQYYALKVIKKKNLHRSASLKMMYQEISVQKKLIHPNIIRLYGHIEDIDNLFLVLEYAERGNLFHHIRRRKYLQEDESWIIFTQVCIGLSYLDQKSIIHRDLKPENILITNENQIKICDFGWCAEGNNERSTYCGTLDYMAPEVLKGYNYTNKVDIWALGILLFEMTHGQPPFNAKSDAEKSRLIRRGEFDFKEDLSSECKDLIKLILRDPPESRPTISAILKHSWIAKFLFTVSRDKINLENFTPGSIVKDINLGQGIVVSSQGLVSEISFITGVKELLIPEFIRINETGSSNRTLSTNSSQNLFKNESIEDKEFEMKLNKNYPPSYKISPIGSRGKLSPKVSNYNNVIAKRKINSEKNIMNSPKHEDLLRSESSKVMETGNCNSVKSDSNSSVGPNLKADNPSCGEVMAERMKELENLQFELEGRSKKSMIVMEHKKKKVGLLSRISGIFKIGCAER
jgi:serine/threonine protein kinase